MLSRDFSEKKRKENGKKGERVREREKVRDKWKTKNGGTGYFKTFYGLQNRLP